MYIGCANSSQEQNRELRWRNGRSRQTVTNAARADIGLSRRGNHRPFIISPFDYNGRNKEFEPCLLEFWVHQTIVLLVGGHQARHIPGAFV